MKQKPITTACQTTLLAFVIALTGIASAGIIVTRGHIVGGAATGTLVAIDSPHISNANGTTGSFGGPLWTTGGTITAHQADQGFAAAPSPSGDGIREFDIGGTPWEPNGTPFSQARGYYIYPDGPSPGTTWTFNLAASGIDLPDGTIIHGVYARYGGRNNDRARYEYTEGTASANLVVDQFATSSAGDLALRWFDADGNPRDSNFQRIFSNPITVTGGDGFQLRITDTTLGNAGHIDAIVLDTSLPKANDLPAISTLLPVDNKTSVVPWTSLEVTFDEPMALTGTGTVTITDLTDGSSTLVINLPDPRVTSPNGDDLLIKPTSRLELGTQYSVKISADALVDLAPTPNPFPGILNDTTWNFSTRSVPGQLHNVLIVTAALADAPPSATAAQATNLIFHDPRNVDEAMRAASYGQIGLNLGDYSGLPTTVELVYPETVAQQKTAGGSSNLKNRMAASLAALGYNTSLSNFRFILYLQPAALNTGNDGWANLYSNTSVYLASTFNHRLAMHEMGHCLGGNHSNGSDLGCALGGADVDYNASKKILFGWLNAFPGSVINLPANTGTSQTLVALSRNPAVMPGTRAVRVPNPNGGTATYLVSYKVDDGPYHTLQNSSYSRKIHVTEDAGGSATTHRATLGAGQEYVIGKLKVRCDSVAADGLSAAATITVNTAPVAIAQSVSVNEDTALPVVLTGTDTDSNPLTYTVVSQPANGTLSGSAPSLSYAPNTNFNGADSFTFKVNDGLVDSAIATVSINVTPVNDAPVALSQSVTTAEDSTLPMTLSGTDVENTVLSYTIVTPPANGTLSGMAPNLSYTPTTDFNGADSFTFTVYDGTVESFSATVSIAVTPVNDAPVAFAQSAVTTEDTSLAITVGGTDPDLDSLSYAIVSPPANGTLSGTAPNLTYSPAANFNGTDSFAFQVNDGTVNSALATVSINVTPVNDAPVAIAQSATTSEDAALPIFLTGIDVDQDTLTYGIVSSPANGTLSGTAPNLTFTPNANFNGADSFTFKVNDGSVDSMITSVAIEVTPVNDAPAALAQSVATTEDTSLAITLGGTDIDLDSLSYTIVSQPSNGTLSGTAPNLTYTPSSNFHGADSFTFSVNDGTVDSAIETVSIMLSPVNDPPVALAQSVTTIEDNALPVVLAATDIDQDPLSYVIVSPPAKGTLSGTVPNLTYTPNANTTGADSFTFKVNDGTVNSMEATVSIDIPAVDDAPVALAQDLATEEDTALAITLTGNDVDQDALTYTVVSEPANGTISGTVPDLTYTPSANFNGADSFTFKVSDGTLDSAVATITINVTAMNDAPVFTISPIVLPEGSVNVPYTGQTLAGRATDIDSGDTLTYSKVSGAAWLVVATDGTLSGTPPSGSTGLNTFVVRATDSGAATADATLEITVTLLPLPWSTVDIGTGMLPGSVSYNAGTFTQGGSGLIGGTSDKFRFSYQTLTGDGSITVRISAMQNTGNNSRVGIMIRDTLATNSKQIFMGLTGSNSYRFVRRLTTAGTTTTGSSATATLPNAWVLLSRQGSTIIAYKSTNGYQWNEVGRHTGTTFGTNCYIGLAVGSGSDTTLNTSSFSNVLVNP